MTKDRWRGPMPRILKSSIICGAVAAVFAFAISASTSARADQIYMVLTKSGKILSSYGSGSLYSHARRRRFLIEGINLDALPRQRIRIEGTVSNLKDRSDIAGTYHAAQGGSSVVSASTSARLENRDKVILELHLIKEDEGIALDLAGLTLTPH